MSKEKSLHESGAKPVTRREMSRRQFLTYTLGGTTAFLAAMPLIPMIRFTVDPILQKKSAADFVKVAKVDELTTEPKSIKFQIHQIDGWYESDPKLEAWVAKDEAGNVFALSPICKHLGCTIGWNTEKNEEYVCPCHGAHYDKNGKNLAVAPNPLDEYEVKVDDQGNVYLGGLMKNSRV